MMLDASLVVPDVAKVHDLGLVRIQRVDRWPPLGSGSLWALDRCGLWRLRKPSRNDRNDLANRPTRVKRRYYGTNLLD